MFNTRYIRSEDTDVDESGAWLSISDLMSGLLMVFALLLIVSLAQLLELTEQSKSKRVIIIEGLQQGLEKADISSAVNAETGAIALSETVLFNKGSARLKTSGKRFLDELIPIYSQVIFQSQDIADEVLYLVIEGHSDREGSSQNAMKLSLDRAYSVVAYIHTMTFPYKGAFIRKILAAGRGDIDARRNDNEGQFRKVVFRFEFLSHDLTEMIKTANAKEVQ
ncbi:MAG: OmpA family protein [Motiliproteus sp.]